MALGNGCFHNIEDLPCGHFPSSQENFWKYLNPIACAVSFHHFTGQDSGI
ncbi:MAG: hypothetical protein JWQ71_3729 [Pedosphaera sp.]|nr:hypothetical protein [Pedosphaera sp.]